MDSDTSFEHGWAETKIRFVLDCYLRRHGWKILERPNNGPAVWINVSGIRLQEEDAVEHEKRKAQEKRKSKR